jgi:hypothetical protein
MGFTFDERPIGTIQVHNHLAVGSDDVDVFRAMVGRVDDNTI